MNNEKNKKKIVIISLTVATLLIVALGVTYAYWILTKQQVRENVVNTACLNITFTGENDISLDKAYPMNEQQLESFLSSATPYHFTIHNECNDLASASINLESLTVSGKVLEDEYIDAILYEDDYNVNLNTNKKLTRTNDENKVIAAAKHAYSLYNFTLKANEEKDFNLLLYMDPDTPMEDANMNASWKGKITLSTEYKEENTTIRKIDTNVNKGMWEYKDKLTKIVIENKKSVKTAEDGGKVYGPYDESADGYGGVQSYVVCDNKETDCIGYLQGTNGIKANEDSSYLFYGFKNVTNIEGLENLNTSYVSNMQAMFMSMTNLQELDLSMWYTSNLTNIMFLIMYDTNLKTLNLSNWDLSNANCIQWYWGATNLDIVDMSNVIFPGDCSNFFYGGPGFKAKKLILKNSDTSQVTNMNNMFNGASNIQELDLSSFDTNQVTNMNNMFSNTTNLQSITFGRNFVHKPDATVSGMFTNCPSQDRPTGESWQDVSFN